jgi:hypothetical protein
MPNYAFGTAGRDEQIARSEVSDQTKQRNISDLLNGVGVLAQSLGAMHRYKQEQANKDVLADFYVRSLSSPGGEAQPLPAGQEGPEYQKPWDAAIGDKLQQGRQPAGSFLEGVGNFFNPQGKLTGDDAIKLADSIRNRQAQQAELALGERKQKVEEFTAASAFQNSQEKRAQDWANVGINMLQAKTAAKAAGVQQDIRDAATLKGQEDRADKNDNRISSLHQRSAMADAILANKDPNGVLLSTLIGITAADGENKGMQAAAASVAQNASPEALKEVVRNIKAQLGDELTRLSTRGAGMGAATNAYEQGVVAPAIRRMGGQPAPAAAPIGWEEFLKTKKNVNPNDRAAVDSISNEDWDRWQAEWTAAGGR